MASGRVYTTRFYAGKSTRERTVVTVPAGVRWVLRDIEIVAIVTVDWYVQFGASVVAGGHLVPPAGQSLGYHWDGRVVANAGETVTITTTPPDVWVTLTGYQFAL